MDRIRYLLDEHLDNAVATALRSRGIDVVTAAEAGLRSATDTLLLVHTHASSRVIVTRDDDFLRLNAEGQAHSGIVFVIFDDFCRRS
jgi:predicted nuclease of predicted toxin-antitoxin system